MTPVAALMASALAWAHNVRVDMLDVGQGDSILLSFADVDGAKHVLIDAGPPSSDVAAQLRLIGVERLDLLVSTHAHADHIGGTSAVLSSLPTRYYLDNGVPHTTQLWDDLATAVSQHQLSGMQILHPGTSFRQARIAADATLTLLSPLAGERVSSTSSDQNANSVVLRLDHGDDCFLFMGDAEAATEELLVAQGLQACDVLKVGHHGSDGASSDAFLAAVRPALALISVGANNGYGHPGPATLDRLEYWGAQVFRTDRDGAITVWSSGHGLRVGVSEAQAVVHAPSLPDPEPVLACPYPASRNGEVYHEAGCGMAERITPGNLVCYPSANAAIAAGRRPGKCCHE